MKLNKEILNTVLAVQYYKKHKIAEGILLNTKNRDWYTPTEEYYHSLPDYILEKAGLKKNINDFEKVLNYNVTDEMLSTLFSGLWIFDF